MVMLKGIERPVLFLSTDEGIVYCLNNDACQVFGHFSKKGRKDIKKIAANATGTDRKPWWTFRRSIL